MAAWNNSMAAIHLFLVYYRDKETGNQILAQKVWYSSQIT